MVDSFNDSPCISMDDLYNSEHVNLLGVQSVLMPLLVHRSHVTIAMSVSTPVAANWLAASDIIITINPRMAR